MPKVYALLVPTTPNAMERPNNLAVKAVVGQMMVVTKRQELKWELKYVQHKLESLK